jgi:hypothetical protein
MEVKSSLFWGWVSQKTEIPADNNAYVYWNGTVVKNFWKWDF